MEYLPGKCMSLSPFILNKVVFPFQTLKEFQEKVWLKDKVMNDFKVNADEALERAAELDKSLEEKDEDAESQKEKIASLALLVNDLRSELARNNVDEIRRELETKEGMIRELRAELNLVKNSLESKEEELEYLKKASEDLQFISSTLEDKEYEVCI
jgi:chromosome segregation ATPase